MALLIYCRQVEGWRVRRPICRNWRLQGYVVWYFLFYNGLRSCAYSVEENQSLYYSIYAGRYLSYQEWGKEPSGRVRLQSAEAKRPMTWRVVNLENNTFSLEAVRLYSISLCHVLNLISYSKRDNACKPLSYCRSTGQNAVLRSCPIPEAVVQSLCVCVAKVCCRGTWSKWGIEGRYLRYLQRYAFCLYGRASGNKICSMGTMT